MLADLPGFFEDVDVFLADGSVGATGIVLVDQLGKAQRARHSGGTAAHNHNVGFHLGTFDSFERLTKDQHEDALETIEIDM